MKARFTAPLLLLLGFLSLAICYAQDQDGPPRGGRGGMMGGVMAAGSGVHGTVTAVSGNEFTVKTEQGDTYKVETGPNTHFMKARQPIKATDVHVGDVVITGGELDDKAHTVGAVFFAVLDAEAVQRMKQAQADFGKTWLAGKITAINDLTLTVERPDKKTQTINVDENTSFQKHRESITLADIKVGDMVSARGALQNGNFVASVLNVMDPNRRGPGGPGGNGVIVGNGPPPQQQPQ
ncbi:MAG TPA: DUF5666 domain-containing protein [Pseudacidobacterium sp.]|jgi:hypothetical protein|nr:DUF5666 domain-containing protein [Pseudacidobacterium sp.]